MSKVSILLLTMGVTLLLLVLFMGIFFSWTDYKVATQDILMFDDTHGVIIKKGDLYKFASIGKTYFFEVECKSGAKGQITDLKIERDFAD